MKRLSTLALALLLALAGTGAAQNTNAPKPTNSASSNNPPAPARKRGPIFRASKDQITQAQNMLKQRGYYNGNADGKLNPDTRAGLRKYQEAEGLKVTGTLNAVTLQKMSIPLTDKQKEMTKPTT